MSKDVFKVMYCGEQADLQNKTALARYGARGQYLIQLDDQRHPLGKGWHPFAWIMWTRVCDDCEMRVDDRRFNMVVLPNSLWRSIAEFHEMLCLRCIEKRLGRKVIFGDFLPFETPIYETGHLQNTREIRCNIDYFRKRKWI